MRDVTLMRMYMTQKYIMIVISAGILPVMAIGSAESRKRQGQTGDPMVFEYKEMTEPIKENILGKLKLVKDKTQYTRGVLDKRLAKVEGLIKSELGKETLDDFWDRTTPLYNEYINTMSEYRWDPTDKKLAEKKKKFDTNQDLNKRHRLDKLIGAEQILKQDLNTQNWLLNKATTRIQNPDDYLKTMHQKTYTESGNVPHRDPLPRLLDNLEYYAKDIKDVGNDPMENWFDENSGYEGRSTISQIPGIIDQIDDVTMYDVDRVDDVLRSEFTTSPHDIRERLGLSIARTKAGGPMFSPMEQTFAQKFASWFSKKTSGPRVSSGQMPGAQSRLGQLYNYLFTPRARTVYPVKPLVPAKPKQPEFDVEYYEMMKPSTVYHATPQVPQQKRPWYKLW